MTDGIHGRDKIIRNIKLLDINDEEINLMKSTI